MEDSLTGLYYQVLTSHSLETKLPENVGNGRIMRISTPRGISLSEWKMSYHRETPVEGQVGNDLRLLFCLGEGIEWKSASGKMMHLNPSQACLCIGDGTAERTCYASGCSYAFRQISIMWKQAEHLLRLYLPGDVVDKFLRTMNGRSFSITRDMQRLLDSFDQSDKDLHGLEMLRLDCRAQELMAQCLEQASGAEAGSGLHPDDLAVVQDVWRRINTDAVSLPSLTGLAAEYAVSVSKLTRDFKRVYGSSIHAFIVGTRLEEARRLLSSGKMTVGEVAERVGYIKHSQFTEAFRRHFGVLPRDY